MSKLTAQWLAHLVEGQLIGSDIEIMGAGRLTDGKEGEIGFLAESKYRHQLENSQLSVVLVNEPQEASITQIVVSDVRKAWQIISQEIENIQKKSIGIHPSAIIDSSAQIGKNVYIGAGVVIEAQAKIGNGVHIEALATIAAGVIVGENTRIGTGARLLSKTTVGKRCNILSNAVIGERGFGNHFEKDHWLPIAQLGGVQIGDDVEIGAGTMIDRGAIGNTIIHDGVKLDNLIQVAHNVEIGAHTAIAGCCVIAGSVKFGQYCVVGGASVFAGHITICDGAQFTGHSSVSKSITKPGIYCSAMTVMPIKQWKHFLAKLRLFGKEK
ncbi:UDP-3-O-(3-hydroxymyristoyl)glucosamine N-acyltransferase [Suttonella ornithocola]|uniref:UDP-3-O-acylglucosamine N-acyltransferase n=1 Tax=Suttonella ornithocola TaxID=279832 RepID=A0A380MXV8_9GAMM|nr:UDP-3-O-(3-hydroxymyristoyl)glucosamine N-acyltransferase [Suttonella ornithocola]SUO97118.1 UDP-3-O-acylglucosamine N-acyltransferase [Suttonella ornithocola]